MVKLTRGLAIFGMALVVAFPVGVASAADSCTYPATCVPIETTTHGRPDTIAPESAPVGAPATGAGATSPASGSSLPVTGGDVVGLTLMGAGAIAVGSVLSRRRGKA